MVLHAVDAEAQHELHCLHCPAGDAQLISRDDLILNLEDSPLPEIARQVLVQAAATADI